MKYKGAVYPRVCGGTTQSDIANPGVQGLSPRVRGNPYGLTRGRISQRSIPACAGEPVAAVGFANHSPVYPRVCGGT